MASFIVELFHFFSSMRAHCGSALQVKMQLTRLPAHSSALHTHIRAFSLSISDVPYKPNLQAFISSWRCPVLFSPWGLTWRWWLNSPLLFFSFLAFQTTSGVKVRYFRQIKNLIAAYQKPEQGIAIPLLYPVTAQRRAQHREAHAPGDSL